MSEYILELKGICKSFPGVKALQGVQMKVRPGKVHALMGENGAGKSTLMKCLLGIYQMDSGEILLEGRTFRPTTVKYAREMGLSIIQQELSPVLERSVMENVWLGREPTYGHCFVNHRKMYEDTKRLMDEYEFPIDPRTVMSSLSVAKIQMVEIIKAISWGAKIVMMDEPTSALTEKEVEHLFRIIEKLKSEGVAVIYISHKMDEIYKVADEISVLRDGKWIAHHFIEDVTMEQIIHEMVGRELEKVESRESVSDPSQVVLKVENLSTYKAFKNVSFELHKGEILGIAGMVGAGRTEVLETLFGLRHQTEGRITIRGKEVKISNTRKAIKEGMAFLTEERRKNGIIGVLNITENIMVTNYPNFMKWGFIKRKKAVRSMMEHYKALGVKAPGPGEIISNLSGGNQQKVLLARWLMSDPEILLLDEPTRGIDVGAKAEIYKIITRLAGEGKSMIVVSSEMPEILRLCDRVMVMSAGRVTGVLDRKEAVPEKVMHMASIQTI